MKTTNLFKGLLVGVLSLTLVTGCATNDDIDDGSNNTTFTAAELANYDGKDGAAAYVAFEGNVYDVTDAEGWDNGEHKGVMAGTDVTDDLADSPHTASIFDGLAIVGTLE